LFNRISARYAEIYLNPFKTAAVIRWTTVAAPTRNVSELEAAI
jgi:hypothetical protein